ncbi:MAG: M48 family metallopeptidase [Pseudomonadota bacterium]
MQDLVYKNEKPLFAIAAVLAAIFWLTLLYFTMGLVLIYVLFAWLFYLFIQSGFIAWIKGNGVEVTPDQFPDIYQHFDQCCSTLGVDKRPRLFLMNGEGMLNALATKFLRTEYVVLFSNTVDALERKPSLVKFYIGHELGHLTRKHLTWAPLLFPVLWLPLFGAAYSRAREYSCDRHGLACADSSEDACYAMAVLAAGERKWADVKFTAYNRQVDETSGFWMSFHELCSDYPWLSKRAVRLVGASRGGDGEVPNRNAFAYLFALLVPRTGMGPAGPLIMIAIIAILAAVAIPAYKDYQQRAAMEAEEAQLEAAYQDYADSQQGLTDDSASYDSGEYGGEYDAATETGAIEDETALATALTGMKVVSAAYVNAYQSNPTQTVNLALMNMTETELQELGIVMLEFTDTAMLATLNAIDSNTGDYHYVRLTVGYEENGNGMYAQCNNSSLQAGQLEGICR